MELSSRYIDNKKDIYRLIIQFVENSDEPDNDDSIFLKLIETIKNQQIVDDPDELQQFLQTIKCISDNHHRNTNFNSKINKIILYYKAQIKQIMSSLDIYHLFESNKNIILFLIQNDIITISDQICSEMINKLEANGNRYCYFFYPEIEKIISKERLTAIKKVLLSKNPNIFNDFDKKRKEGENDSYICSLIRNDSVENFISHINRFNISLTSQILPSLFETNPFLIENNKPTLIEYSAFFGSIQIFQYLVMNQVKMTSSLWNYVIHSNNGELFHFLESNKVPLPKNKFDKDDYMSCLMESIKCHHNDFANYIEINLLSEKKIDKEIFSCYLKHHNYSYFNSNVLSADENEIEVIYCLLQKETKIRKEFFGCNTKLKKIAIPSSITSIETASFSECISLEKVTIPSSVTKIESDTFYGCSKLIEISISPKATSIGHNAFCACYSLKRISIPSSVNLIENSAFYGCSLLSEITIPFSVVSISDYTFCMCSSLTYINIPFSVTKIGKNAFNGCESLTYISIPTSVKSIGSGCFIGCSSIKNLKIPSSVTEIGIKAFYGCSLLK